MTTPMTHSGKEKKEDIEKRDRLKEYITEVVSGAVRRALIKQSASRHDTGAYIQNELVEAVYDNVRSLIHSSQQQARVETAERFLKLTEPSKEPSNPNAIPLSSLGSASGAVAEGFWIRRIKETANEILSSNTSKE